jgi:hypothetical protein
MLDSDFWRDLGERFRHINPEGALQANWTTLVFGEQSSDVWEVFGTGTLGPSIRAQFEPLATRAGLKLDKHCSQPIELWLSAIKAEVPQLDMVGPSGSVFRESGSIKRVCQASADLCHALEARALKAENAGSIAVPIEVGFSSDERELQAMDHGPVPGAELPESVSAVPARSASEERRQQVNKFLEECNAVSARRILRRHIWRLAGHSTARQFEYWQSGNAKASSEDNQNFTRILQTPPSDVIAALSRKGLLK